MHASLKRIQITSLGGLAVAVNDECIGAHQWKSHKAYQMLSTIVALGGKNISISAISDAIWPDIDGDKAMQNMEFILRRLRQILQKELGDPSKGSQIIHLSNGKVSLNSECCELDIWTWQALTEQARAWRKSGYSDAAQKIEQQAATILRGEFLAGEEVIIASQRIVWHTRFCNWIHEVTLRWRQDELIPHDQIIALLDVGLGIDPCSEKLCLQRMYVLLDGGYTVDAMLFFKQWAMYVKEIHGLHPSVKVHAVYKNIRPNPYYS